jgi:hypothetical protein
VRNNNCPEEQCEEGWRNDYTLDPEQVSQLLDWHKRQECLNNPVEEEAEEIAGSNVCRGRQVVWKVDHARPDGFESAAKI